MRKEFLYIISLVLVFACVSCEDFLDKLPDNRTQLNSPEKVKELLVNAYPEYSYGKFCFSMTDNAVDKGPGYVFNRENYEGYNWMEFSGDSQDSPTGYWNACYTAISHVNQALDFMKDKINKDGDNIKVDERYAPYYGEALVARAYAHFMLVNLYSKTYNPETASSDMGIPYVESPEKEVFVQYKRGTVEDTYKKIEEDLLEGLKYIDDSAYEVPKYHFNKAAANVFASRFYLMKKDWKKVIEYTTVVLGLEPVNLLRDINTTYADMGLDEQSAEYSKASEKANLLIISNVSSWFSYYQASVRYTMDNAQIDKMYKNLLVAGEWQPTSEYGNGSAFLLKWGYFFKRISVSSDIGYYYVMTPTIVVEEALFNRAEANAMLGNKQNVIKDMNIYLYKRLYKYDAVKSVVDAAKIESEYAESKVNFKLKPFYNGEIIEENRAYLNFVIDFRRKEFIYDGTRWFDIRRFNLRVEHNIVGGIPIVLEEEDSRKQIQIPVSAQQYGIKPNPR